MNLSEIQTEKARAADDLVRCQGKAARAQTRKGREAFERAAQEHRKRLLALKALELRARRRDQPAA